MEAIPLLRQQIHETHEMLEGTMNDVTPEQAQWSPGGKATPLGAQYAHIIAGEDVFINMMVRGSQPLLMSSFAGKAGMSEPPPMGDWGDWAGRLKVDLSALRQYAQAVYQNTTDYVASLQPEDLQREIDLSAVGLGKQNLGWVLTAIAITHPASHCGEISCLKGLQGAKGYPF